MEWIFGGAIETENLERKPSNFALAD
ncbi:hypothetical protein MXB_2361 [Myxobolus squamalis]|nr:hypothetical protein MXB_2361 [Myxobolus squamalis]